MIIHTDDISCICRLREKMMGEIELSWWGAMTFGLIAGVISQLTRSFCEHKGSWELMDSDRCLLSAFDSFCSDFSTQHLSLSAWQITMRFNKPLERQQLWLRNAVGRSLRVHFYKNYTFFPTIQHDTQRMGVASCVSYALSGLALALAAGAVELVRNAAQQNGARPDLL